GATLTDLGLAPSLPDGVDVVQRGSFLAVVADREADAVRGMEFVGRRSTWTGGGDLPPGLDEADRLEAEARPGTAIVDGTAVVEDPGPPLDHEGVVVSARYTKPFVLHGSIGPSAAVARYDESSGRLEVWCHSPGVELLRY